MCHGHRGHGLRRRRFGSQGPPGSAKHFLGKKREDWQRRLEEYQRDLEQELADVTDILERLREGTPAEPQTVRI